MRKWVWIGVALLMVVALAVGGGAALANQDTNAAASLDGGYQWGGYPGNATLTRIATVLGVTPTELITQLQSGKTLAQVAKDKGVATDKIVEAIMAPRKDHIQLRVKYGYITQAQADQFLATARQQAESILNQTFLTSGTGALGYAGRENCPMAGSYGGGMMGRGVVGSRGNPGFGTGSPGRGMMGGW